MRTLPWVIAGASSAMAWLLLKQPNLQQATGTGATGETSSWGAKPKLAGAGAILLGKVKHGLGELTGNNTLKVEGAVDQAVGSLADSMGNVASAAGQTLHDLTK